MGSVALTACSSGSVRTDGGAQPGTTTTTSWASGASGDGVADGSFGDWRGRPVQVAGTWSDDAEGQRNLWPLQPGAEYSAWTGDLDLAVGAIYRSAGETWQGAADGLYDERWSACLQNLDSLRTGSDGSVYLRFAHEFNGDWFDWAVEHGDVTNFKRAWRRFRDLQSQWCPTAQLVFCPNVSTSGDGALDWRQAFPGPDLVDVMSVDFYNQYPFVDTVEGFQTAAMAVDDRGAPRGLEQHRRFAEEVGLPFAVSEWSGNADAGDSGVFFRQVHEWCTRHAGSGPGRLLYEVQFNVGSSHDGRFQLYPVSRQPEASATYRELW